MWRLGHPGTSAAAASSSRRCSSGEWLVCAYTSCWNAISARSISAAARASSGPVTTTRRSPTTGAHRARSGRRRWSSRRRVWRRTGGRARRAGRSAHTPHRRPARRSTSRDPHVRYPRHPVHHSPGHRNLVLADPRRELEHAFRLAPGNAQDRLTHHGALAAELVGEWPQIVLPALAEDVLQPVRIAHHVLERGVLPAGQRADGGPSARRAVADRVEPLAAGLCPVLYRLCVVD